MIELLAARLPERQIDVVGDAAYATEAWRGVNARVTVTSRLRADAALYDRQPPRTGKQGRPRKWGQQLAGLAKIATDSATQWTRHRALLIGPVARTRGSIATERTESARVRAGLSTSV
jgi:hypothetical protein